jgi:hypothetical protein
MEELLTTKAGWRIPLYDLNFRGPKSQGQGDSIGEPSDLPELQNFRSWTFYKVYVFFVK